MMSILSLITINHFYIIYGIIGLLIGLYIVTSTRCLNLHWYNKIVLIILLIQIWPLIVVINLFDDLGACG
jgi:hypothetical protein